MCLSHKKTKILEKLQFVSQHSLLLARCTDVPCSLRRLLSAVGLKFNTLNQKRNSMTVLFLTGSRLQITSW